MTLLYIHFTITIFITIFVYRCFCCYYHRNYQFHNDYCLLIDYHFYHFLIGIIVFYYHYRYILLTSYVTVIVAIFITLTNFIIPIFVFNYHHCYFVMTVISFITTIFITIFVCGCYCCYHYQNYQFHYHYHLIQSSAVSLLQRNNCRNIFGGKKKWRGGYCVFCSKIFPPFTYITFSLANFTPFILPLSLHWVFGDFYFLLYLIIIIFFFFLRFLFSLDDFFVPSCSSAFIVLPARPFIIYWIPISTEYS